MTGLDDGWNLVKLNGDRNGHVENDNSDPISSKSQLSIDIISDESNVDDDILSNTSSDEYAELSHCLRSRNVNMHSSRYLEGSYDTLTGSTASHGGLGDQPEVKAENSGMRGFLTHAFVKGREKGHSLRWKKLWDSGWFSNNTLKLWHVVTISSLLSMFVFIGIQSYSPSFFNSLAKNGPSVTYGTHYNDNAHSNQLVYGNINFVNHQDSNQLSWRPTGKYYVDFDNHIAYPITENDLIGLQKYKTDVLILWHTARVRWGKFLNANLIPSSKNLYRKFIRFFIEDANKLANFFHSFQISLRNSCNSFLPRIRCRSDRILNILQRFSQNISRKCQLEYQSLKVQASPSPEAKRNFKKLFQLHFLVKKGRLLKKKSHCLLRKINSKMIPLHKVLKKGRRAEGRLVPNINRAVLLC